MIKNINILIPLLLATLLISCEDEVVLDLPDAPPVLVVDAFINDKPGPQEISLTLTQPYFSNDLPDDISGASVSVEDDLGNEFIFSETAPGRYTWVPAADETIGAIGRSYTLSVTYDGFSYRADSEMKRVPPVDSVVFTYREESTPFQGVG